ncbi:MAG: hypothetical protein VW709_18375, partial [Rickettsiales bacterium]
MFAVLRILAIVLMVSLAAPTAAETDDTALGKLVSELGAKSFKKKAQAIEALAATGDSRAAAILEAMLSRNLFQTKSDGSVVVATKEGEIFTAVHPITGTALEGIVKSDLKNIRINNRLRKILQGAIGGLSLQHKDPARRISAADAVFKSRAAAMMGPLEQAVASEPDATVKEHMQRALAAVQLLHGTEAAVRMTAVSTLSAYSDPAIRSFLSARMAQKSDGSFVEADASVREAIGKVLEKAERSAAMWGMVQNLFQGVSLGSVLLLAAIGLAITFGVMGVINMAHGEMVMLGAYTTFVVQEVFR